MWSIQIHRARDTYSTLEHIYVFILPFFLSLCYTFIQQMPCYDIHVNEGCEAETANDASMIVLR